MPHNLETNASFRIVELQPPFCLTKMEGRFYVSDQAVYISRPCVDYGYSGQRGFHVDYGYSGLLRLCGLWIQWIMYTVDCGDYVDYGYFGSCGLCVSHHRML